MKAIDQPDLAPKTFFIEPDPHVVSESFLERAFLLGYECYSIPRHFVRNLSEKIPALLDLFPSILLFLSLDHDEQLEGWREHYKTIQSHADCSKRVGILISPFVLPTTADKVRKVSLLEVGMEGGCVEMLTSPSKSQERLLQVLHYSEAQGRRKVIRWVARSSDVVTFNAGTKVSVPLWDISISHFSVLVPRPPAEWQVGTKIEDVSIRFSGALLFVSAVLAITRRAAEGMLCVFLFPEEHSEARPNSSLQSKVNSCIFNQHQKATMLKVQNRFQGKKEPSPTEYVLG